VRGVLASGVLLAVIGVACGGSAMDRLDELDTTSVTADTSAGSPQSTESGSRTTESVPSAAPSRAPTDGSDRATAPAAPTAPSTTEPRESAGGRLTPLWRAEGIPSSWSNAVVGGSFISLGEVVYGSPETFVLSTIDVATGVIVESVSMPGASSWAWSPVGVVAVYLGDGTEVSQLWDPTSRSVGGQVAGQVVVADPLLVGFHGEVFDPATGALVRQLEGNRVLNVVEGIAVIEDDAGVIGIDVTTGLTEWTVPFPESVSLVDRHVAFDDRTLVRFLGGPSVLVDADGSSAPVTLPETVDRLLDDASPPPQCGKSRTRTAGFYFETVCSNDVLVVVDRETDELIVHDTSSFEATSIAACGKRLSGTDVTVVGTMLFCHHSEDSALVAVDAASGRVLAQVSLEADDVTLHSDGRYVVALLGGSSDPAVVLGFEFAAG
jgi:hypothetical protein